MQSFLNLKLAQKETKIWPLVTFRIVFGVLMLFAVLRFWSKGWIHELYIAPDFHFKYFGFEWVTPFTGNGMYWVFALMGLAALCIALGFFYRISAALFFLSFTYVELLDVANYLNHYYFVSLVAFLLIFFPAHRQVSLDVKLGMARPHKKVNWWAVNLLRIQISLVYIFAGLAKLHPDWLFEAMPLKIWLPTHSDLFLIGPLFDYEITAYIFSWGGALYDLSIPFFLWNKRTRPYAFAAVIGFHLLTWVLFPIGIFPWVMIFLALIFFSEDFHYTFLKKFRIQFYKEKTQVFKPKFSTISKFGMAVFLIFQIIFPFRYLAYPDSLFWTEEGYRFSWRVMLMEKAGTVSYHLTDPKTGNQTEIDPSDYLTENQEKQLATQPDLILQFAHFLEEEFEKTGIENPKITAESYVTLNGNPSRLLINPDTDLTKIREDFHHKKWILSYDK